LISSLAKILLKQRRIIALRIEDEIMSNESLSALGHALENKATLTSLTIKDSSFTTEGIRRLATAIPSCAKLHHICITDSNLRDDDLIALSSGLHDNRTVTGLYLTGNGFGIRGCLALAEALRTSTVLRILDIRTMGLRACDITVLLQVLQENYSLFEIRCLCGNDTAGNTWLVGERNKFIYKYEFDVSRSADKEEIQLLLHGGSLNVRGLSSVARDDIENIRQFQRSIDNHLGQVGRITNPDKHRCAVY
jgi:hypothetical protein